MIFSTTHTCNNWYCKVPTSSKMPEIIRQNQIRLDHILTLRKYTWGLLGPGWALTWRSNLISTPVSLLIELKITSNLQLSSVLYVLIKSYISIKGVDVEVVILLFQSSFLTVAKFEIKSGLSRKFWTNLQLYKCLIWILDIKLLKWYAAILYSCIQSYVFYVKVH